MIELDSRNADHKVKELNRKSLPLVRVIGDDVTGDTTWMIEEEIRQ